MLGLKALNYLQSIFDLKTKLDVVLDRKIVFFYVCKVWTGKTVRKTDTLTEIFKRYEHERQIKICCQLCYWCISLKEITSTVASP